jgi:hypothetical protein
VYNEGFMSKSNKMASATEEQIPELAKLAKLATKSAYRQVLASGNSVLISKNGEIRRVFPNGSTEFVMKSARTIRMRKGTIIKIK